MCSKTFDVLPIYVPVVIKRLIIQLSFDISSTYSIFESGCYELCQIELDKIPALKLTKENNDTLYDRILVFIGKFTKTR